MSASDKKKQSARQVWNNQMFLWKLCFKTCPGYMIYFLYDGFRYQGIIFLEHVLGIRYVLHCAEFNEPFQKAFLVIGVILIVNMIQIVPDGFFIYKWSPTCKPRLYQALKEQMFKKAAQIDLSCYDDPKYYNDFVLAVAEAESSIDRFLNMCNLIMQAITVIFTTGVFYIVTDAAGIFFVLASLVFRFLVSKVLNKLNYDLRIKTNPLERKRNYVSRVFYLNDYAKELRLHQNIGDHLEKEFSEANDEIIKERKAISFRRSFLTFARNYVVGDFIMDGLYITYLVFQAAVLGTVAYSDAVVLFNRTGSLRRAMGNLADIFPQAQENSLYVEKIRAFLDYEPRMNIMEGRDVPEGNADLVLDHVSFRYSEDAEDTLKDISIRIKAGERVAIVGYNGAGKTTLIKLLMRLYDPTSGTISYHGTDIREFSPYDYRRRIGVVFQDFQMYGATLGENVVMDRAHSTDTAEKDKKIISALKKSGFESRLKSLPKGLDTPVTTEFEEEGINFSGGESQKIAISRAFYKDADMLIMDEPSSALDPIAEYELNKAMESAAEGKTVFYISHRLSTTRDADRILMLENGRIVEEGDHASLLELGGKYAQMWKVQAGRYEGA
ncbi:MAG: ABC transporter ATP-binding protein/permease [Lachnospiraceae bacterium]|nr:ABC transporter ATP-binding protein/permease [Lachnospiraceae bacterium]